MIIQNDITTVDDVRHLVNTFYTSVRSNSTLAPVFALRISNDAWGPHLDRMTLFWSHLLLGEHGYSGNPLRQHMGLPLTEQHFTVWLSLWTSTVMANFRGPTADDAIIKARNIADVFRSRLIANDVIRSL
jgi:hemoglobin